MLYGKQPAPGVGDAVRAAADVGEVGRLLFTGSLRTFGDRLGDSVGASDHVFFGSWIIFLGRVPGFRER
jgi:hypothetical protein